MRENEVRRTITDLERFCREQGWKGYDPYDGLNSKFLRLLTLKGKWLRVAVIQFFRRVPLNLRKIFLIEKGYNPKALGLFLDGYVNLYQSTGKKEYKDLIALFVRLLKENASPGYSGYCWGYNFDWQSRAFYTPKGTPTLVNTSFIGEALFRAYKALDSPEYLEMAHSACEFMLQDLNRSCEGEALCFSYTPLDRSQIYNASILGARLLARVGREIGDQEFLAIAKKAVGYVVDCQNADGSWYYGGATNQKWIDNFHTGFVLEALADYIDITGNKELGANLRAGLEFYLANFFTEEGAPKYYPDTTYPVDIHSCAQAIITLKKLRNIRPDVEDWLDKVVEWTLKNMRSQSGCFYFQKHRFYTNKIPYTRWSQAWMFKALSYLLKNSQESRSQGSRVCKP